MIAALVTSVLLAAPPAADSPAAQAVVRRVEELHGREVTERGVVSIKRPGRMRWEYKDPEAKTFVSDGRRFYFYVPADHQVIVRQQDEERSIPSLLLAGKGDILGQFAAELDTPSAEG